MKNFKITWEDMDGNTHIDYIVDVYNPKYKTFNVNYIHKWENTREELLYFLGNLPMINTKITEFE
jgi:hypothetical protein